MTVQSVSSIARQVVAVVATVFGILTSSVSALHLPVSVSTVLTAIGPVILGIEHYVGDPSTGRTPVIDGPVVSRPVPQAATPGPQPVPELPV